MDVRELRLDNLVKRRSKDEILTVDLKLLADIQRMPVFFKPIPLTEEWLIKMGFKYDNISYINKDFYNIVKTRRGFDFGFEYQDYNTPIDYVHQLQNLYHSLTGSELTIKE